MTEYIAPEQQQIDHWFKVAHDDIAHQLKNFNLIFIKLKIYLFKLFMLVPQLIMLSWLVFNF